MEFYVKAHSIRANSFEIELFLTIEVTGSHSGPCNPSYWGFGIQELLDTKNTSQGLWD